MECSFLTKNEETLKYNKKAQTPKRFEEKKFAKNDWKKSPQKVRNGLSNFKFAFSLFFFFVFEKKTFSINFEIERKQIQTNKQNIKHFVVEISIKIIQIRIIKIKRRNKTKILNIINRTTINKKYLYYIFHLFNNINYFFDKK